MASYIHFTITVSERKIDIYDLTDYSIKQYLNETIVAVHQPIITKHSFVPNHGKRFAYLITFISVNQRIAIRSYLSIFLRQQKDCLQGAQKPRKIFNKV